VTSLSQLESLISAKNYCIFPFIKDHFSLCIKNRGSVKHGSTCMYCIIFPKFLPQIVGGTYIKWSLVHGKMRILNLAFSFKDELH